MTELVFVHDNLYTDALKVAKNYVSKSQTRPILTYALHTEDGILWATDSHRMLQIKNIHGYTEEALVQPHSRMVARGGNYPRLDTLLEKSQKECVPSIELDKEQIKVWMNLFKGILSTMKALKGYYNYEVGIRNTAESIEVEFLIPEVKMTLPGTISDNSQPFGTAYFNAEYMKQALETFVTMSSERLEISFVDHSKPFLLSDKERVNVMILPIRKY